MTHYLLEPRTTDTTSTTSTNIPLNEINSGGMRRKQILYSRSFFLIFVEPKTTVTTSTTNTVQSPVAFRQSVVVNEVNNRSSKLGYVIITIKNIHYLFI